MDTAEAILRFQTLARVVGEPWMQRNPAWFEAATMPLRSWYEQADRDLQVLTEKMNPDALTGAYRHMLRDPNQLRDALFEIHGSALLAAASTSAELHVTTGEGHTTNFDVRARIRGHLINADCKTRTDRFPFNFPRSDGDPDGIIGYHGSRATLDPHDAEAMGIPADHSRSDAHYIGMPESTVIRQRLQDALVQLPQAGINLVLFGHALGDRLHLEHALFGVPVLDLIRNHESKEVASDWRLAGTAAFAGRDVAFSKLGGVLWMRIWQLDGMLGRSYKLYRNSYATSLLPDDATESISAIMREWSTEAE